MTDAEVDAFWADGVVCLRGVLPVSWVERVQVAVERALAARDGTDLTAMAERIARAGGAALADESVTTPRRGRFFAGTDHWTRDAAFRAFATASPLPAIVARLLRAGQVFLYEDSLLVKEPGTVEATAWHTDLSYFHLRGDQICTTWCPLDVVTRETGGVGYVRGSHRWPREFKPNFFVSRAAIPGTEGEDVPDVSSFGPEHPQLWFDTAPGDVVVHHARTLHGAPGNRSATQRRRALSVRYCGDDARFHRRPGAPLKAWQEQAAEGAVLGGEGCPQVHPSA